MSLTVGVDSYVSVEEANRIAAETYLSNNEILVKWKALSDSDKEVLLRTSCRDINNLKFDGVKQSVGQILAFPRRYTHPVGIGYALYISQYRDNSLFGSGDINDGGLNVAKLAQVENALYHNLLDGAVTKQAGINIQGLTSKHAGPISESYDLNNRYNRNALRGIYTDKVYSILVDWLCDSRATI